MGRNPRSGRSFITPRSKHAYRQYKSGAAASRKARQALRRQASAKAPTEVQIETLRRLGVTRTPRSMLAAAMLLKKLRRKLGEI